MVLAIEFQGNHGHARIFLVVMGSSNLPLEISGVVRADRLRLIGRYTSVKLNTDFVARELAPAGARSGPAFKKGLLRSPAGASSLATGSSLTDMWLAQALSCRRERLHRAFGGANDGYR
ncbi:hypothetical protein F7R05_05330 [Pseudomonas koreensis]|nr:hypothetical protein F7R05_05330 [Pseudomonas koreensis]